VDKELGLLEQQSAELRQRYTEGHPAVAEVAAKLRSVRARKAELARRQQQLTRAELEAARLARELKTATDQYLPLVGEVERLKVIRAGAAAGAASSTRPSSRCGRRARGRRGCSASPRCWAWSGRAAALARKTAGGSAAAAERLAQGLALPVFAALRIARRCAASRGAGERRRRSCPPSSPATRPSTASGR
jgi:predicted RNase H-like nuclease (RuvC/YqgF family)